MDALKSDILLNINQSFGLKTELVSDNKQVDTAMLGECLFSDISQDSFHNSLKAQISDLLKPNNKINIKTITSDASAKTGFESIPFINGNNKAFIPTPKSIENSNIINSHSFVSLKETNQFNKEYTPDDVIQEHTADASPYLNTAVLSQSLPEYNANFAVNNQITSTLPVQIEQKEIMNNARLAVEKESNSAVFSNSSEVLQSSATDNQPVEKEAELTISGAHYFALNADLKDNSNILIFSNLDTDSNSELKPNENNEFTNTTVSRTKVIENNTDNKIDKIESVANNDITDSISIASNQQAEKCEFSSDSGKITSSSFSLTNLEPKNQIVSNESISEVSARDSIKQDKPEIHTNSAVLDSEQKYATQDNTSLINIDRKNKSEISNSNKYANLNNTSSFVETNKAESVGLLSLELKTNTLSKMENYNEPLLELKYESRNESIQKTDSLNDIDFKAFFSITDDENTMSAPENIYKKEDNQTRNLSNNTAKYNSHENDNKQQIIVNKNIKNTNAKNELSSLSNAISNSEDNTPPTIQFKESLTKQGASINSNTEINNSNNTNSNENSEQNANSKAQYSTLIANNEQMNNINTEKVENKPNQTKITKNADVEPRADISNDGKNQSSKLTVITANQTIKGNVTTAQNKLPSVVRTIVPTEIPKIVSNFAQSFQLEGVHTARLVMEPTTLGTVIVELTVKGNAAELKFTTESKETQKLIENQIPVLKEKLIERGITTTNIEYKSKSDDKGQNQQQNNNGSYSEKHSNEQRQSRRKYLNSDTFRNQFNFIKDFEIEEKFEKAV